MHVAHIAHVMHRFKLVPNSGERSINTFETKGLLSGRVRGFLAASWSHVSFSFGRLGCFYLRRGEKGCCLLAVDLLGVKGGCCLCLL